MKNTKWTKEEEEYLRENYKKVSESELEEKLNRNIKAICQKARRMGLSASIKWTKEEDNYLKENWGKLKIDTLCKRLNRSKRAVQERAYRTLNLGSQLQWYSLKEVADITGINKDTIRKKIISQNLPHHRAKTKQKPYMLDINQLMKFLKENQDLWRYDSLTINVFELKTKWLVEKIEKDKTTLKKYNKSWTDYEDKVMLDRVKRGYSYEQIAEELGRTVQGVRGRHRFRYNYRF